MLLGFGGDLQNLVALYPARESRIGRENGHENAENRHDLRQNCLLGLLTPVRGIS
jgi:hypothetical protein